MTSPLQQAIEALEAALDYIQASPCDPDITREQWEAYKRMDALKPVAVVAELRRWEETEGWTMHEQETCEHEGVPMTRFHHAEPGNHDGPAILLVRKDTDGGERG